MFRKFDLIKYVAKCAFSQSIHDCKIGFIGLGNMGSHMATNLLKANHRLVINDINKDSLNGVINAAINTEFVQIAQTPAQVARSGCDVIITILPSTPQVKTVLFDEASGLIGELRPDTVVIDSTTGDPAIIPEILREFEKRGAQYLDAPVSGGVIGARDANLTFMVGGAEATVTRVTPILKKMGKNVFHCGTHGNGLGVKLCNNMLMAVSMIGASEALNMGRRLGLDLATLTNIMSVSTSRCWSVDTYNPVPGIKEAAPASRNYEGGFSTALMLKDLELAMKVSKDNGAAVDLGQYATEFYKRLASKDSNLANKDFSVAYDVIKKK